MRIALRACAAVIEQPGAGVGVPPIGVGVGVAVLGGTVPGGGVAGGTVGVLVGVGVGVIGGAVGGQTQVAWPVQDGFLHLPAEQVIPTRQFAVVAQTVLHAGTGVGGVVGGQTQVVWPVQDGFLHLPAEQVSPTLQFAVVAQTELHTGTGVGGVVGGFGVGVAGGAVAGGAVGPGVFVGNAHARICVSCDHTEHHRICQPALHADHAVHAAGGQCVDMVVVHEQLPTVPFPTQYVVPHLMVQVTVVVPFGDVQSAVWVHLPPHGTAKTFVRTKLGNNKIPKTTKTRDKSFLTEIKYFTISDYTN